MSRDPRRMISLTLSRPLDEDDERASGEGSDEKSSNDAYQRACLGTVTVGAVGGRVRGERFAGVARRRLSQQRKFQWIHQFERIECPGFIERFCDR